MSGTLFNGVGRYIRQLRKVNLFYCHHDGSSKGLREFIELDLVDTARNSPDVVFHAQHRPFRHPFLIAEFLNGRTRNISLRNLSRDEVGSFVERLRNSSGDKIKKMQKNIVTDTPSVQGNWHPYLNPSNTAKSAQ